MLSHGNVDFFEITPDKKYVQSKMSIFIKKLTSIDKFSLAGTNLNGFISCCITERMSVTPEIWMVTNHHPVLGASTILVIGAGIAMLARALTGVLTQVRG